MNIQANKTRKYEHKFNKLQELYIKTFHKQNVCVCMRDTKSYQLNATLVGEKFVKICEILLTSEHLYAHICMH